MSNNNVYLLGTYGGDERFALSAWQSTAIELKAFLPKEVHDRVDFLFRETQKKKKKNYKDLLTMLAEHGHHTPFEKSALDFQITGEIATHIQCIKHRIGVSINSESARYKELEDKWYIPSDWRGTRVQEEAFGTIHGSDLVNITYKARDWAEVLDSYCRLGHDLYHLATSQLSKPLGRKRAKESARYFLPYAKQLNYDMMFNFRSFAHFCGLRAESHAQQEIQHVAKKMIRLIKQEGGFDISLEAFGLLDLI